MAQTKRKAVRKKIAPKKPPEAISLGIDLEFKDSIPRSVLAKLLDLAGKPNEISPRLLMGKPGELYPFQLAELYGYDFIELPKDSNVTLTPIFLRIAETLLNPRTNLTFRVWGDYDMCAETNIQFPGHIIDGNGVTLNQIGTTYQIGAFVSESDILKVLGPLLPDDSGKKDNFEFEGHFETSVAVVLFSFIDLARRAIRLKGSDNLTENDIVFSSLQLNEYLFKEWGVTGFEDLLTYITTAGIMNEPPSLTEIGQGLDILAKANIITKIKGDKYSISPVLLPLIILTSSDQSGLQWQRITLIEPGEILWSDRLFVFFDKSMILQISPTVENRIHIARVTSNDIINFLTEEFTLPTVLVTVPVAISEDATKSATPIETTIEEIATARKLPQERKLTTKKKCSHCGTIYDSDTAICKNCGRFFLPEGEEVQAAVEQSAQMIQESTTQEDKVCRYCGRANSANAATCKSCGQPLTIKQRISSQPMKQPSPVITAPSPDNQEIANIQKQIDVLQKDMKSYQVELNKLEVRRKVGELTTTQYDESVKNLQNKLRELEKTAESLSSKL